MRSLLLVASLSFFSSGCASTRFIEHVSSASPDHAWLAGNDGYALYYDGQRLVPRDYPLAQHKDDYRAGKLPTARILEREGVPFLFTRAGDLFRWDGSRWERIQVRWKEDGSAAQLDQVVLLKDGRWAIQVHTKDFLLASHEDLLASRFERSTLPSYFLWMGEVEGRLYGAGFDASGEKPAIARREPDGQWKRWPLAAKRIFGVVHLPRGGVAAVTGNGFEIVEEEGKELTPPRVVTFSPMLELSNLIAEGKIRVMGVQPGIVDASSRGIDYWKFGNYPVGVWQNGAGLAGITSEGTIIQGTKEATPALK